MLLVLAFVALASLATWAQQSNTAGIKVAGQVAQSLVAHTLKTTYVSSGALDETLSSGYVAIDSANTITCPGTSGNCLVQADSWVEVGDESYTGNRVANCLYVDGTLVNGTCYYSGEVPADDSYFQSSSSISTTVKFGKHTVQTYIYTTDGANVGYYNINYKVFKP